MATIHIQWLENHKLIDIGLIVKGTKSVILYQSSLIGYITNNSSLCFDLLLVSIIKLDPVNNFISFRVLPLNS